MAYCEAQYIGPNLADLVPEAAFAATSHACRSIVGSGRDRLFDVAKDLTPVETGATRESWIKEPVMPHGSSGYEGKAVNPDNVASYLEYGVRAHDISAHDGGELEWTDPLTGRVMRTRHVHHPGITARHMAANAGAALEATLGAVAEPHLQAWRDEVEMAITEATKGR
jgi:hypothetical protein